MPSIRTSSRRAAPTANSPPWRRNEEFCMSRRISAAASARRMRRSARPCPKSSSRPSCCWSRRATAAIADAIEATGARVIVADNLDAGGATRRRGRHRAVRILESSAPDSNAWRAAISPRCAACSGRIFPGLSRPLIQPGLIKRPGASSLRPRLRCRSPRSPILRRRQKQTRRHQ